MVVIKIITGLIIVALFCVGIGIGGYKVGKVVTKVVGEGINEEDPDYIEIWFTGFVTIFLFSLVCLLGYVIGNEVFS